MCLVTRVRKIMEGWECLRRDVHKREAPPAGCGFRAPCALLVSELGPHPGHDRLIHPVVQLQRRVGRAVLRNAACSAGSITEQAHRDDIPCESKNQRMRAGAWSSVPAVSLGCMSYNVLT